MIMKGGLLFSTFLLFTSFALAQETKTYDFDYYSVYDSNPGSVDVSDEMHILGNSNDSSYIVYFSTSQSKVKHMGLYDITNNIQYDFETNNTDIDSIKSFTDITSSYTIFKCSRDEIKNKKEDFIEITSENIGNETKTILKVYKNKRKKKVKCKIHLFTEEVSFTDKQLFFNEIVYTPLQLLNEIDLKGILTKVYFEDQNTSLTLKRELKSIRPITFSLKLKTTPINKREYFIININK